MHQGFIQVQKHQLNSMITLINQEDVSLSGSPSAFVLSVAPIIGSTLVVDAVDVLGFPENRVVTALNDNYGNTFTHIKTTRNHHFYYAHITNSGPGYKITPTLEGFLFISSGGGRALVHEYSETLNFDYVVEDPPQLGTGLFEVTGTPTTYTDSVIFNYNIGSTPVYYDESYNEITFLDPNYTDWFSFFVFSNVHTNYVQNRIITSQETPYMSFNATSPVTNLEQDGMIQGLIVLGLNTVVTPPCVKIRGKCKLRGNIKIR